MSKDAMKKVTYTKKYIFSDLVKLCDLRQVFLEHMCLPQYLPSFFFQPRALRSKYRLDVVNITMQRILVCFMHFLVGLLYIYFYREQSRS